MVDFAGVPVAIGKAGRARAGYRKRGCLGLMPRAVGASITAALIRSRGRLGMTVIIP